MKKVAVYGKYMPKKCVDALSKYAERTICIPASAYLDEPVNNHPDTLFFADGGVFLCGREYYRANTGFFREIGIIPEFTDDPAKPYPHEVKLNAFTMCTGASKILIGKLSALANELISAYDRAIDVRQGYARCLTAKVAENAFITSDRGIFNAVTAAGGNCLEISPGYITLSGFEYGFIGGASCLCDSELLFFGDITRHPDYAAMREFASKFGTVLVSLSDEKLTDAGGALFFR